MQWTEVSLQTTHEQADTIADILYSAGAQGVAMEDPLLINQLRSSGTWELCDIPEQQNTEVVTVTAYYPDDDKLNERLEYISNEVKAVEERIGAKCVFRNPLFRTLCEQDWANEWKQYFHVTHIGRRLVIKPSWEQYDAKPEELVIEIDPGMAFGTGTHHTTSMCMAELENIITPEAEVFDVGCGSGILAIAAAKLGAKSVVAVDIDANAVRIAKENIAQNGLRGAITVKEGDLLHGTEGKADVIIANIIADIIIMLLPDIPQKLKAGGKFLASGIIEEREADVAAAAEKAGLKVIKVNHKGGWSAMLMEMK